MRKRLFALLLITIVVLSGCQKKDAGQNLDGNNNKIKDVPVVDLVNSVKEVFGDDYIPNMPYDESSLEELFGVKKDWYEEYIAQGPMISAHVDTFVAVKAKKEKIEDVEKALSAYRESLISDTMQYPSNQIKIQASRVTTYGNYVFFIMLGMIPMETEDQGEEAALKAYQDENQKAVDAIESVLLEH